MAIRTTRALAVVALFLGALCFTACDDDGTNGPLDEGPASEGGADGGSEGEDAGTADPGEGDDDAGNGDEDAGEGDGGPTAEYEAKFLIEHNAADDDTGFQIFFDWDPWAALTVVGPDADILDVEALDTLADFGLTEMFFETNEPPATEEPLEDVLARFPAGEYAFQATSVEGEALEVMATLSHDIPQPVELLSPEEDAEVDPEQPLEISWSEVTGTLEGGEADIAAYQVILGRDLELPTGEGFFALTYNVTVPPEVTSLPVAAEYLRPGTPYEIEILALEASGNQTIAASAFETTGEPIDDLTEVPEPGPTELAAAKFLIEHNATDDDTGYQIFLDGEPWAMAGVDGPEESLLTVLPQGALADFGLTEMFFETNEPEAAETPLEDVLTLFPEGSYAFIADTVDGENVMTGEAMLSHAIPEATTISSPAEGSEVDATMPLEVSWTEVSTSVGGEDVEIVAYQVIVVKEEDLPPSAGFFEPSFSAHVPADTTRVTVPAAFLEAGAEYEIEVLALEASGNQTIALTTFETP